jgi:hypothetical protein
VLWHMKSLEMLKNSAVSGVELASTLVRPTRLYLAGCEKHQH